MPPPRSADFCTAQLRRLSRKQVPLFHHCNTPSPGPQASSFLSVPGLCAGLWPLETGPDMRFRPAFVLLPFGAKVGCELIKQAAASKHVDGKRGSFCGRHATAKRQDQGAGGRFCLGAVH